MVDPGIGPGGDPPEGLEDSLTNRAAAAGVLAGIAVALAAIVLAVNAPSEKVPMIGWGTSTFAALSLGLSGVLFLNSAEFFLQGREALGGVGTRSGKPDVPTTYTRWNIGAYLYDGAIFLLLGGLFFVILPVSWPVAVVVFVVGFLPQLGQLLRIGESRGPKASQKGATPVPVAATDPSKGTGGPAAGPEPPKS